MPTAGGDRSGSEDGTTTPEGKCKAGELEGGSYDGGDEFCAPGLPCVPDLNTGEGECSETEFKADGADCSSNDDARAPSANPRSRRFGAAA